MRTPRVGDTIRYKGRRGIYETYPDGTGVVQRILICGDMMVEPKGKGIAVRVYPEEVVEVLKR